MSIAGRLNTKTIWLLTLTLIGAMIVPAGCGRTPSPSPPVTTPVSPTPAPAPMPMPMPTPAPTPSPATPNNQTPNVVPTPGPVPGANEIWMLGSQFVPAKLTVAVGTTVTWINKEYDIHTVTSYTGLFDSAAMDFGQKYSYTFNQTGIFNFFCKPHPDMICTITVK